MKQNEVVQKVLDCLQEHGPITAVDWDDPRVEDFVRELRKVGPRHELGDQHDVFIDLDVAAQKVTIFKAQASADPDAASAAPKKRRRKRKSAEASKTTPATEVRKVDRTKHSFTPPPFSPTVLRILQDSKPHNLWFWGPTGCGKTAYVSWLGGELDRKVFRVNCREDMTSETVLGDQVLGYHQGADGSVASIIEYQIGLVEKAMVEGLDDQGNEISAPGILYVDEVASAPPHVIILLNRLLENDVSKRTIVIDMDGGREVTSHSGFRVIFAANTQGRGATTVMEGGYTAQHNAQDMAFLDRMLYFRFGYNKEAEERILKEKIGNDRVVERVIKFRNSIRSEIKQGRLQTAFSTRRIVAIGDMFRVLGSIEEAVYRTVFEAIMPEELAKYNEIANLHLGKDLLSQFQNSTKFDYM